MLPFAARPRVLPPVGEGDDTSPPAADDPYALSAGVGRDAPNRRDDVLRVETVLSRLGRFDATPTGGPTGYPGMRLVESLTGLQKDHGLTVDGRALPGGETLGAMRSEDVARGSAEKPAPSTAVYRPTAGQPALLSPGLARMGRRNLFDEEQRRQQDRLRRLVSLPPQVRPEAPRVSEKPGLIQPSPLKKAERDTAAQVEAQRGPQGPAAVAKKDLHKVERWFHVIDQGPRIDRKVLLSGLGVPDALVETAPPETTRIAAAVAMLPRLSRAQQKDVFAEIQKFEDAGNKDLAKHLKLAVMHQAWSKNPLPASMSDEQLKRAADGRQRLKQGIDDALRFLDALPAENRDKDKKRGRSRTRRSEVLKELAKWIAGGVRAAVQDNPWQRQLDLRGSGGVVDPRLYYQPRQQTLDGEQPHSPDIPRF